MNLNSNQNLYNSLTKEIQKRITKTYQIKMQNASNKIFLNIQLQKYQHLFQFHIQIQTISSAKDPYYIISQLDKHGQFQYIDTVYILDELLLSIVHDIIGSCISNYHMQQLYAQYIK